VGLPARAIHSNQALVHDPVVTIRQRNWTQIICAISLMSLSIVFAFLIQRGELVFSFGSAIFTLAVCLMGIMILRTTKSTVLVIDRVNRKLVCSKATMLGNSQKRATIGFEAIKDIEIIRRIRGSSSFQQVSYIVKLPLTKQCGLVSSKLLVK
jgi:hypothetical protein